MKTGTVTTYSEMNETDAVVGLPIPPLHRSHYDLYPTLLVRLNLFGPLPVSTPFGLLLV